MNDQVTDSLEKAKILVMHGTDYILTDEDKVEIAGIVLSELPLWNGGSY